MRSLTVRLPDRLVREIEAESRDRNCAKSDIVRERLQLRAPHAANSRLDEIADLIGSIRGLPAGLSADRKKRLKAAGYGKKRPR